MEDNFNNNRLKPVQMERIFLAQLICYSGDGVLYTRIYKTSNPDTANNISQIFDADLEKDGFTIRGLHPVIVEMTSHIDNLDRDLRRINNERFSTRLVGICKGLNIKTVYGARKFNWNEIAGTKVRMGNGYPIKIEQWLINRITKELNEYR
jgi:hypothetical protein